MFQQVDFITDKDDLVFEFKLKEDDCLFYLSQQPMKSLGDVLSSPTPPIQLLGTTTYNDSERTMIRLLEINIFVLLD